MGEEPPQGEGEFLPPVEAYLAALEKIVGENAAVLDTIGGNIMIHIFDMATWVIVTRGPRPGFYYQEDVEEPIDFALMLEEWVLMDLLDPDCEVDVEELVDEGYLVLEGDLRVYERLMRFASQENMLSLMQGRLH